MKDLCEKCIYKDNLKSCLLTACPYLNILPVRELRKMLEDAEPKKPDCKTCKNYEVEEC